jgi:hypothetical protein
MVKLIRGSGWKALLCCATLAGGVRGARAMSCGELRLMDASGVIGPKQSYTATARCGEEYTVDNGTKLTWGGLESSSTNVSVWMNVIGKGSWDRKTGMATETLKITGDATGERVAHGTCNEDPFLKDPPGGTANCQNVTAQYKAEGGPVYQWFSQPRFFLARTVSLAEAEALSQQKSTAPQPPAPQPPPPKPSHPMLSSPSGSRVWEGEALLEGGKTLLQGGHLSVQPMRGFGAGWSGDAQLLWTGGQVGAVLDLRVDVKTVGSYRVTLALTKGPDYGLIQAEVGGKASGVKFDGFSPRVTRDESVDLGVFPLEPGARNVSLMIIGRNSQSKGYLVGIDRILLKPAAETERRGESRR